MSTPACVSCQESLSCDDSPLSITASIIAILTFVGALTISIQVYVNSMRNAAQNIRTLRSHIKEVRLLHNKTQAKSRYIDGNLEARLQIALRTVDENCHKAASLLERVDDGQHLGEHRFWVRARSVLREDLIKEGLENTGRAMEMLKEVANDVSSEVTPEPAAHEVDFRNQILQELVEMRNEMKNLKDTNTNVLQEVRDLLRDSISH